MKKDLSFWNRSCIYPLLMVCLRGLVHNYLTFITSLFIYCDCSSKSETYYNSLGWTFFHTFQQIWRVFMHSVSVFVCQSVRLSASARFSCRKYTLNVLKLTYNSHIWYCIHGIQYRSNGSSRDTHKTFPTTYNLGGGVKFLTYSYCIKCNEIDIRHSDVQKHASYIYMKRCTLRKNIYRLHLQRIVKYFLIPLTRNTDF